MTVTVNFTDRGRTAPQGVRSRHLKAPRRVMTRHSQFDCGGAVYCSRLGLRCYGVSGMGPTECH
jgi:hypothetical protein